MKITQSQIRKLIQNEINESTKAAPAKTVAKQKRSDIVNIDIDSILSEQKEESLDTLNEGMFSSALKTVGANLAPGGRWVADYTRARGFDELEEASEDFESRLQTLEAWMASVMGTTV